MVMESYVVGDKVRTCHNEIGQIEKPYTDEQNSYDWWIELRFMFEGREFTTSEPYKNSELTRFQENLDQNS